MISAPLRCREELSAVFDRQILFSDRPSTVILVPIAAQNIRDARGAGITEPGNGPRSQRFCGEAAGGGKPLPYLGGSDMASASRLAQPFGPLSNADFNASPKLDSPSLAAVCCASLAW